MNILYITSFFLPEISGISHHVYEIAKRMERRYSHDITVYAYGLRGYLNPPDEKFNGLNIRRYRPLVSNGYELRLIPVHLLLRLLAETDYDIVHVHGYTNLEPLAVYLPRKFKRTFGLNKHTILTPNYHPRSPTFVRNFARIMLNATLGNSIFDAFSRVIALTSLEKEHLFRFCNKDRIVVIPNGIDVNEIDKAPIDFFRSAFDFDESCKLILYAGKFLRYKGVHYLLYAFKDLLKYIKDVKLLVIGEGPHKDTLLRMTKQLSLERNVIFSGFLERKMLLSALKVCDVFVMPSSYEAFSIITAEAMACGKPVIASNMGGLQELGLNKEFLVEYGDAFNITRLMTYILENQDIAKDIGFNNRAIAVNKFSWDNVIKRIQDLYLELAADPRLNVKT